MARPLRLEFSGALYQVMARGNERRSDYAARFSDHDRAMAQASLGPMPKVPRLEEGSADAGASQST